MQYRDFVSKALRDGHAKGANQREKMKDAARLWREFKAGNSAAPAAAPTKKAPKKMKGKGADPPVAGQFEVVDVAEPDRPKAAMKGGKKAAAPKTTPPAPKKTARKPKIMAPAPSSLNGGELEGGNFLSKIPIVGSLFGGDLRVAGQIPADMVGRGSMNPFEALSTVQNPLLSAAKMLTGGGLEGGCSDCDQLHGEGVGERIMDNISATIQNLAPAALTLVPLLV